MKGITVRNLLQITMSPWVSWIPHGMLNIVITILILRQKRFATGQIQRRRRHSLRVLRLLLFAGETLSSSQEFKALATVYTCRPLALGFGDRTRESIGAWFTSSSVKKLEKSRASSTNGHCRQRRGPPSAGFYRNWAMFKLRTGKFAVSDEPNCPRYLEYKSPAISLAISSLTHCAPLRSKL